MSNKGLAIKTTVGELQWVTISGKGRDYKKNDIFKYSASVILSATEGKELADKISAFYKESEHFSKTGRKPFEKLDKGDNIGKYVFKFSTKTTWADGNAKVIEVYNSKGKEITGAFADKKIANGSTGCLSGNLCTYDGGSTLYLDAIQLVKFIEYKQGADFDDIGEGYTGEEDQKFESIEEPVEKLTL